MTLQTKEVFKLGDMVKVIDERGNKIGTIGDVGVVVGIRNPPGEEQALEVRLQTGHWAGQLTKRYVYRWELVQSDWDN